MTVRILIGENEDVKELAEEFPQEASVIEEMLNVAESDAETEEEELKKEKELAIRIVNSLCEEVKAGCKLADS